MYRKHIRSIVSIDEDKCDGCGLCIPACAEGALQIVDGKARLIKEIYCDGIGDCLGECPQGAIEIIKREAEPFNEEAVQEHLKEVENKQEAQTHKYPVCSAVSCEQNDERLENRTGLVSIPSENQETVEAELSHWPIQIHLVSPEARFLKKQKLLISADCVPFAFADFHRQFLSGHSLLIGCPKLDDTDLYHQKLVEIFQKNQLESITLVYMEVGCCHGISRLVKSALKSANSDIPLTEIVITVDGSVKATSSN